MASCSFDKHGLILTIFGKQHQHTFKTRTYLLQTDRVSLAHTICRGHLRDLEI